MTKLGKSEHDCPDCHCGLTEVWWADRTWYIDPTDPDQIIRVLVTWAFDHYYDRRETLPHGLPDAVRDSVTPWLLTWLDTQVPQWRKHTIDGDLLLGDVPARTKLEQDMRGMKIGWRVQRHGGRSTDVWTSISDMPGLAESEARPWYEQRLTRSRDNLRLLNPLGVVIERRLTIHETYGKKAGE